HDLAGVQPDADGEVETLPQAQRIGIPAELFLEVERRIAGAPRMVLVCNRRTEERHDAVAGEMGDGALEAMDSLGEQRGEPLHDAVEHLGVEVLGELHRPLHVGEEHRDLLARALERRLRLGDLQGEVLRSRGAGTASRRSDLLREALATAVAELLAGGVLMPAARARPAAAQARAARAAEARAVGILVLAARAVHGA